MVTVLNQPTGFTCITPNAHENSYSIASGYSTTINKGDPVAVTGTGVGNIPGIAIAALGSAVIGVFLGVNYVDSAGQPQYSKSWVANTVATSVEALVIDDPFAVFRIQCNTTNPFVVTDYYNLCDWIAASGTNGISGYQVDTTTLGSGTNLQIRRTYPVGNNALGTGTILEVAFTKHTNNYPYTQV